MPSTEEMVLRENTKEPLNRMQSFDPQSLSREDLGTELSFKPVIPAVSRLIQLYKQISPSVLEDLPSNILTAIQSQSNTDFNRLNQVINFKIAEQSNPIEAQQNLIKQIENSYQGSFTILHPIISYSTSKSADFKRLENEARAMIQNTEDSAKKLTEEMQKTKTEAERVLEEIRKIAAEQGVSQQAMYFNEATTSHETEADKFSKQIRNWAIALGVYSVITIFLHKIPYIKPDDLYQTIQLAISKVLIFGVISYMLYLSTKNYLAHKHNSILNKHRQNALMTYTALVEAAKDLPNKDIILTHASSCIFAPQATGYSSAQSPDGPVAKSVVELLTKSILPDTK